MVCKGGSWEDEYVVQVDTDKRQISKHELHVAVHCPTGFWALCARADSERDVLLRLALAHGLEALCGHWYCHQSYVGHRVVDKRPRAFLLGRSSINTSSCVQFTLQFAFCVQSAIKNSLATMPGYGVDSDGDVEMTTPQPIFEFIRAPRLNTWSQAALIQFKRERSVREEDREALRSDEREQGQCAGQHQGVGGDTRLGSFGPFHPPKESGSGDDADILAEIQRKCGTILNAHVPDVMGAFKEWLIMDLQEQDIQARISKYFVDFDRLVEEKGFLGMLGCGEEDQEPDRQKMKLRCRILVENLAHAVLQVDVKRLVEMTHRGRTDDVLLYKLIVERATMQHNFHLMQKETKEPRVAAKARTPSATTSAKPPLTKPAAGAATKTKAAASAPTSRGTTVECWVCKGGHTMRDCPTATEAEKEAALAAWRERRNSKTERAKHVAEDIAKKVVLVNGILEIPLCPDTGSDRNIISRDYLEELKELSAEVATTPLAKAITVKATGGAEFVCREGATLDLKLTTAAGPLHLPRVPVIVLEGPEDEFLLGRVTLKEIGIDIDRLLEQLASGGNDGGISAAEEDDLPPDEELGFDAEDADVAAAMENLVDKAVSNGFDEAHVEGLRRLVREFPDVFRLHIGSDPAADVEPLEVQVVPCAVPFRCKLRNRWACAALPVRKSNDEYRMTVDYRPVNRLTVPLAAATPNLAVVTQSVKDAYGFGSFDLLRGSGSCH
ncbi:unnamed protein product [Phytophthora lilii]|uniref:Unnamed protein product n=1 Tax=Phytophthora lilii TaxID=2077276 RepID=A0A9W6YL65_9STRA|nr:unnamed protein product [Phytophthora lilii]